MNYISLELELDILDNYLSIEKLTRVNSFEYSIKLSSPIDSEEEGIPPMIIQPFLENSIIHGIASKESIGKINISFSIDEEFLWVEIEDNGVGIEKAKELKSQRHQRHKSVALEVIQSRLQNHYNGTNSYTFQMEDRVKDGKVLGAVVTLKLKRKVLW
jgi:sensor histidine kinase YesM